MNFRKLLILALSLILACTEITGTAFAGPFHSNCTNCVGMQACQTVYSAGQENGQLQVHIGGAQHNIIETYFFDNYYTDVFTGEVNLHCYSQVKLAKPSDFGTYAIRYGRNSDQFVAYGVFKKQKLIKITNDPRQLSSNEVGLVLGVDQGYPVCLEWISTRVLKVKHGPSQSKTLVLKFFGEEGDGNWSVLNGDGTAAQVKGIAP